MHDAMQGAKSLIGSSLTVLGMRGVLSILVSKEFDISLASAFRRASIVVLGSYMVGRNFRSGQMAAEAYAARYTRWLNKMEEEQPLASVCEMHQRASQDSEAEAG